MKVPWGYESGNSPGPWHLGDSQLAMGRLPKSGKRGPSINQPPSQELPLAEVMEGVGERSSMKKKRGYPDPLGLPGLSMAIGYD